MFKSLTPLKQYLISSQLFLLGQAMTCITSLPGRSLLHTNVFSLWFHDSLKLLPSFCSPNSKFLWVLVVLGVKP